MKNFIIGVLLIAVTILSYLHFFKGQTIVPPITKNTKTLELGKDSLKISFYVDERLDSLNIENPPEGEPKKTQLLYSIQAATTDCDPATDPNCENISNLKLNCCPQPPPNVQPPFEKYLRNYIKLIKGINIERVNTSVVRGK